MDKRKSKESRERTSERFKGKKPNVILLTQEQIDTISKELSVDDSQLITQAMWKKLIPVLGMSEMAFARRATLSRFKVKIRYAWEEYECGTHSTKAFIQLRCIHCPTVYTTRGIKMMSRRHKVQVCPKCYSSRYLYDEEWQKQNSTAQLIAQNKPETLEKHRTNSRLMWTGEHGNVMREAQKKSVSRISYRENMALVMRNKWDSDPDYRDRVSGKGSYKHVGVYKDTVSYHSKLELAFLLWYEENGKYADRCQFSIPYIDPEDEKEHKYYPDFVVDTSVIEVKGQRWIDFSPRTYLAKIDALALYCSANNLSYRVVLDKDLKAYAKKANAYHEAQKQNDDCI